MTGRRAERVGRRDDLIVSAVTDPLGSHVVTSGERHLLHWCTDHDTAVEVARLVLVNGPDVCGADWRPLIDNLPEALIEIQRNVYRHKADTAEYHQAQLLCRLKEGDCFLYICEDRLPSSDEVKRAMRAFVVYEICATESSRNGRIYHCLGLTGDSGFREFGEFHRVILLPEFYDGRADDDDANDPPTAAEPEPVPPSPDELYATAEGWGGYFR